MAFNDESERTSYFKTVDLIGRATNPSSAAAKLFYGGVLPAGVALSIAPEMTTLGGRSIPIVVIGVNADVVALSDIDDLVQRLSAPGWIANPWYAAEGPGVTPPSNTAPFTVRRERPPRNQSRAGTMQKADSPPRPGDSITTVRMVVQKNAAMTFLGSGGTFGGLVLVGGSRVGLISCSHVMAMPYSGPPSPGSTSDVVTWPGTDRAVGRREAAAVRDGRIATLARWTDRDDKFDVALAILEDDALLRVAEPLDPRLIPTGPGHASPRDTVRFTGAARSDTREGQVLSNAAQVLLPETGEVGQDFISYGTSLGNGRWASVTDGGDSGAWLIGDGGIAVGMHKMARRCEFDVSGTCLDPASTLSYAHPLDLALSHLSTLASVALRDEDASSLALSSLTIEVLTPETRARLLMGVRSRVRSHIFRPCISPVHRKDRLMNTGATYQFFFGSTDESPSKVTRPIPSAAVGGNEGFPRFSRLRLTNGFQGDPAGSGRKVISATAVPARNLPLQPGAGTQPPEIGIGEAITLVTATAAGYNVVNSPLVDRSAVCVSDLGIGAHEANKHPSEITVTVVHEPMGGGAQVTSIITASAKALLGDDFNHNYFTEVDVELTKFNAAKVKFEVWVSYVLRVDTADGNFVDVLSRELLKTQLEVI